MTLSVGTRLEPVRGEARFGRLMDDLKAECDGYRRLYRDLQVSRGRDSDSGKAPLH